MSTIAFARTTSAGSPAASPADRIPATGEELAAGLADERLAEHRRRSGYVLMRDHGARPHGTG